MTIFDGLSFYDRRTEIDELSSRKKLWRRSLTSVPSLLRITTVDAVFVVVVAIGGEMIAVNNRSAYVDVRAQLVPSEIASDRCRHRAT